MFRKDLNRDAGSSTRKTWLALMWAALMGSSLACASTVPTVAARAPTPPTKAASAETATTSDAHAPGSPATAPGGAKVATSEKGAIPKPAGAPKDADPVCIEADRATLDALFAKRYRRRHCPLCTRKAAVEPIALPGRKTPAKDMLVRTAAGVRGRRKTVVLYYFMIPCAPCDALLPDVQRVMRGRRRADIEVIPVMDVFEDQLSDDAFLAEVAEKFPPDLRRLAGVFRDAAPYGEGFRKIDRGAPATVVFSGPDLDRVKVLYGAEQTRFWRTEAAKSRPRGRGAS